MNGEIQSGVVLGAACVGTALAAARAAQGLTVDQVAARLRLTSAQVKAIEAGDFRMLPGTVFARGYVRNYARLLGMDAAPLLSAMAQSEPSVDVRADERMLRDTKGIVMNPVRLRGIPVAAIVVAVVVGALAFYEFLLNDAHGVKPLPLTAMPVPPVAKAAGGYEAKGQTLPVVIERQTRPDEGKPPAGDASISRGLHFLFSQESWVEVRDGVGNILFAQINLPGTERVVQGDPPFRVVIGGARGVQLAYNGSPVDLAAHATEDVARLRLE